MFETLPRDKFVPEAYRNVAYADAPIPLPHGEWMLIPKMEGRVLQALDPKPDEQRAGDRHRQWLLRRLPRQARPRSALGGHPPGFHRERRQDPEKPRPQEREARDPRRHASSTGWNSAMT